MSGSVTLKSLRDLERWTIIEVSWVDIVEDNTGNAEAAYLVTRNTLGRVWELKKSEGVNVLVLTFTKDPDGPDQSGWICIPVSVIRHIDVIRKEEKNGKIQGEVSRQSKKAD